MEDIVGCWRRLLFSNIQVGIRQRPTLPGRLQPSTISVWRLNFCVRYGNRWDPPAIATGNCMTFSGDALRKCGSFGPVSRFRSRCPSTMLAFLRSSRPCTHPENRTGKVTWSICIDPKAALNAPESENILDQALDRLVPASCTCYHAFTADLSTLWSSRGLTCSKQWESSSSGGLHA